MDSNNDGKISRQEFLEFMGKLFAPMIENMVFGSEKTVNQQEVENFMNEQGESAMYL